MTETKFTLWWKIWRQYQLTRRTSHWTWSEAITKQSPRLPCRRYQRRRFEDGRSWTGWLCPVQIRFRRRCRELPPDPELRRKNLSCSWAGPDRVWRLFGSVARFGTALRRSCRRRSNWYLLWLVGRAPWRRRERLPMGRRRTIPSCRLPMRRRCRIACTW